MAARAVAVGAGLDALPNVGPASRRWLRAVGVTNLGQLRALGPVGAYRVLRSHGYNASLNLVYALHAALEGIDWRALRAEDRAALKAAAAEALRPRCAWCGADPLYVRYHDEEWGVPSRDDRHLFEMLILEGAQAGLSWSTILKKRAAYREAFAGFDPRRVARFGPVEFARLMENAGIVRNRLKIEAAAKNARACLEVQTEFGSFAGYLWRFVGGRPIQNGWREPAEIPARTAESDALSKDLKRRGFTFVGSTICYAFMQAVGLVNDHAVGCFRHGPVSRLGR
jgi:DNA-3-methyladenine glycosylase I